MISTNEESRDRYKEECKCECTEGNEVNKLGHRSISQGRDGSREVNWRTAKREYS